MSKSKSTGYVYKPRNNELLYCLLYEREWLKLLQNKTYSKLLSYLIEEVKPDEEGEFAKISVKDVMEAITDKRVSKWLPMIFEDLVELNFKAPELFRKHDSDSLYELYFKDSIHKTHFHFKLWMNKALQVYDEFQWYFLKGKFSMDFFWIERISHRFDNGELSTTVWLKSGFPNRYRDLLYQRADFEGKMNHFDHYNRSDYEIDDELKRIYYRT